MRLLTVCCAGLALFSNTAFAYVGYVVDSGVPTVFAIDTATSSVIGTVSTGSFPGFGAPLNVALSPDGKTAYVADPENVLIYVIDADPGSSSFNQVTAAISTPDVIPLRMAVTPNGQSLYCGTTEDGAILVFDTATNMFTAEVSGVPDDAGFFALSFYPDGTYAYLSDINNNAVIAVDTDPNHMAYNTIIGAIDAPGGTSIVFTPDGNYAYLSGVYMDGGYVAVIDANPNSSTWNTIIGFVNVNDPFESFEEVVALAISPDGTLVYALDGDLECLSTISTMTNAVIQQTFFSIDETFPFSSIAITPDGSSVYMPTITPSGVEVMNTANYNLSSVTNTTGISFEEPIWVAIGPLTFSAPAREPYDINRLRPIYEAEVNETKNRLSNSF